MSNTKKLLVAATVAFSAATVQADFVGVQDPLGWDRGDAKSGFVDFDFYSGASSTGNASAANGGGVAGTIDVASSGLLLGGGDRIYDFGEVISWDINASSSLFDTNFIELQVKENAGAGLANVNAFVNGEAADSLSIFDDGNGHSITRFLWELDSTILAGASFNVSLDNSNLNSHQSYDSFSLDASAVSTVPVPAAAWLFGSALMGLGVVRRKS